MKLGLGNHRSNKWDDEWGGGDRVKVVFVIGAACAASGMNKLLRRALETISACFMLDSFRITQ